MTIQLHQDFKEFLKLLNANEVEYLVIEGYAVGYYGHPRPTGDLDIWVSRTPPNGANVIRTLSDFGFSSPEITEKLFELDRSLIRIGIAPFRLEIITSIDGVSFDECYPSRQVTELDGIMVNFISLPDLRKNKKAAGRLKDLSDLEVLGRE